jgi:hypothetical protein
MPSAWPWLSALLSPDRWLLWLGLLFVLSVYHFPTGVVGRLRAISAARQRRPSAPPVSADDRSTFVAEVEAGPCRSRGSVSRPIAP